MTSGGNFVPRPAGAIQADDNTLAGRTPKPKLVPTDDDDEAPANPKADRRAEAKQSGAAKARADSLPERTNPGNAERNDNPRNPATTQTDGVGFEPTNDFRRCRFSKVGEGPPEAVGTNSPENSDEKLLKPFPPGQAASGPREGTEPNRATTSQTETTHQTGQRQVATGLSRNESKWPESWRSAQALARLPSGWRDSSPQAGGTVSGKPSPPVLRA